MVRTPLHCHPRTVHEVHLRPHGGQELGPLPDLPRVLGARQPHRLEHGPQYSTEPHHHRPANTGSLSGLRGACPNSHLHPATHAHRRPPGHCGTYAIESCHGSGHTTHIPQPHVPTTRCHATPDRPDQGPQTPVLATVMPPAQAPPSPRRTTTGTTHTLASLRTPRAPMPQRRHLSTATATRQAPDAPSAYAIGNRRPGPATRAKGSV